eukprot:4018292-Ditylum_brightwellii.AAC.1
MVPRCITRNGNDNKEGFWSLMPTMSLSYYGAAAVIPPSFFPAGGLCEASKPLFLDYKQN